MREKLIEILRAPIFVHELADPTEAVADYLLGNGVAPVVHGRWVAVPSSDMMTGKAYKCSECSKMRYGSYMPNYCQCCGAKMDKEVNSDA